MKTMPWMSMPTLLLGLAVAACGAGGDADEWQGSVQDSAGVRIVTNTGTGLWQEDESWTVEQDLVIGTAEGEAHFQFGQISGLDVDADGRIYVMDQQASEVRVFDDDGAFVLAMGQAGAGPGELSQGAGPVFVGPGDTVAVPDIVQQRITRYTPTGETAASHPLPMTGGIAARWMEDRDHTLVQQAVVMQFPGQEEVEPRNLLLRRAPSGAILDTLLELPVSRTVSFAGGQPSITLFESEPMWAIDHEGRIYWGVNSEYSLKVHSADGELERILARDHERRPVTSSDQTEYRRIIEGLWRDQGMNAQALAMMSQALNFAEFYPAYANLMAGPGGTLWIQRIQTPDEVMELGDAFDIQDMGSATWDVFDPDGRLLGAVRMPPRFNPLLFQEDVIYGVLRDDLDVQYVARMRIVRGAERRG